MLTTEVRERRSGVGSVRAHQVWTVVLAAAGQLMVALDTLVVTTSLPALRAGLHASLGSLEWTINAYNLAFACCLLTGAALGDRFGRRRMYVTGLLVFTAASAAAALAPNIGALVAARTVQGAGAAIVMPLTLTLISEAFPPERRGAAIGLWGGIAGVGIAAGPVVGGAIVSGISWHWIFWLNVPIGVALIPLAARRLTESFGPGRHLDVAGLVLAGAGLLGLTWALVRTSAVGWDSAEVLTTMIAGLAVLGVFVLWEHAAKAPMIGLQLFRDRTFAAANAVSLLMYAGLFGALFFVAQFLQNGLAESPLEAGLRLLPWAAPPIVMMPVAGKLAGRVGDRPLMVVGLSMQAAGLAWLATAATPGIAYWTVAAALATQSVGTSLCFPAVANAALGSVPPAQAGVASGTNSAIREVGGVLGVAVLASVFARHGAYASPAVFADGFRTAMWGAVAFSVAGAGVALCTARRQPPQPGAAARASETLAHTA